MVDDDHEGLVFLGEFFLLEIERLLLIFLSAEDADLDVVGERHGSFRAVAIGLHLASLNLERHLVFAVGGLLRRGGDGFVVVENNSIEAVIDQVLEFGRSLRADGIDQHAGVGVRIAEGVGGAGSVVAST